MSVWNERLLQISESDSFFVWVLCFFPILNNQWLDHSLNTFSVNPFLFSIHSFFSLFDDWFALPQSFVFPKLTKYHDSDDCNQNCPSNRAPNDNHETTFLLLLFDAGPFRSWQIFIHVWWTWDAKICIVAQSASCDITLNARMIEWSKVFLALACSVDWSWVKPFGIVAFCAVFFRSAGSAYRVIVTWFAYVSIHEEKIKARETKSLIGASVATGKKFEALMAFSSDQCITVVGTGVTEGFIVSAIGAVFATIQTQ